MKDALLGGSSDLVELGHFWPRLSKQAIPSACEQSILPTVMDRKHYGHR